MFLGRTVLDMPMRESSSSTVAEVLRANGKPLLNYLHFIQDFIFGALHACTFLEICLLNTLCLLYKFIHRSNSMSVSLSVCLLNQYCFTLQCSFS